MKIQNVLQVNLNFDRFGDFAKTLVFLLFLAVMPLFWEAYGLNGWIMVMEISIVGLCLMEVNNVEHKSMKLFCDTFVKCVRVLKG